MCFTKSVLIYWKAFEYGTTFKPTDMPETTSIQKQITYGEYVKKVKQGQYDDVFSAFVLPYSKYDNEHIDRFNHILEFVGIARAKWIDSETERSRRIAAILVDTTFLINNWVKKNEDNTDYLMRMCYNVTEYHCISITILVNIEERRALKWV